MDSAPSPHNDGLSLSNRGLNLYSDLDDLYRAVRHVLDRTFSVTFMEQRPSPPPRSYLEVARRLPNPQAPSSSPPMRSVPTSSHSRGASQPPTDSTPTEEEELGDRLPFSDGFHHPRKEKARLRQGTKPAQKRQECCTQSVRFSVLHRLSSRKLLLLTAAARHAIKAET